MISFDENEIHLETLLTITIKSIIPKDLKIEDLIFNKNILKAASCFSL